MSMEIDGTQSLQFNETLSGSQKAPELTRKLKDLHEELRNLEQETIEKSSLRTVANQLVQKQILEHSNGTVKILAAICIADIFRLYAPDQPYDKANLKRVFAFFGSQLSLFEKRNNTYEYRFYLLESLSTVKSVIILGDLDQHHAEEIINSYFFNFFKVSANKDVGNNVKIGMTEILIQIIEEVGIFSQDCVEVILEQFGKYDKESTDGPYQMAFEICRSCPNVIQRRVCQYFSDVIMAISRSDSSEEEIEELKRSHELIRKVYSALPELLLNVLPQLQEEMSVDEDTIREVAIETIGQMLADSQSNLVEQYPSLWKAWLDRRHDKNLRLRLRWLDLVEEVSRRHPDLISQINDCLKSKLADPEEEMRAATCKLVGEMQSSIIDIKKIDRDLLEQTAARSKDKKASVRKQAMEAIGLIYNNFFDQLNDRVAMDRVGWIPTTLMNGIYVGDLSVMMTLESALQEYIFPEDEDDSERVDRLVAVVGSLERKAEIAFSAILKKQKSFMDEMQKYLEICEANITNNMDEHEKMKNEEYMKYLAAYFPEKARTYNSLLSYLSVCTKKNVKLLKNSINADADYKTVIKAKTTFLEELNETDGAIAEIFTAILNKASPTILNKSSIPALMKLTQTSRGRKTVSNQKAVVAQVILKQISEDYPTMYKTYIKDLEKGIIGNGNTSIVDESLTILASICKSSVKKAKFDRDVVGRLVDFINEGTITQAEHASIILANTTGIVSITSQLIESMTTNAEMAYPRLNIILTCLAQFALYCPESLDSEIDALIYFVEKDLLNGPSPECDEEKNPFWSPFDLLPLVSQEKVLGARLLISYLNGCEKLPGNSQQYSEIIFPILWSLLDRSCSSAIADGLIASETSHLRLTASLALLQLTESNKFGSELTIAKFEKLSLICQDNCFHVRLEFVESIMKLLQSEQLHPRFYASLFLLAHEPEARLLKQAKTFSHKRLQVQGAEKTLVVVLTHFIHLLAHHPDFSIASEDLDIFAQYIKFFLASVATSTNISILYHAAQRIKLSSDVVIESLSKNSYVVSDLVCLLIKTKCKESNWPLNALGERIHLHPKLYRPLSSGPVQNETLKTTFLPAPFMDKYEELHNQKLGDKRVRGLSVGSTKKPKL
ncbi:hypothetical protein K501DRAFT_229043, partial [Backusella circina FSU 941]